MNQSQFSGRRKIGIWDFFESKHYEVCNLEVMIKCKKIENSNTERLFL